jgi:hypothetical protein
MAAILRLVFDDQLAVARRRDAAEFERLFGRPYSPEAAAVAAAVPTVFPDLVSGADFIRAGPSGVAVETRRIPDDQLVRTIQGAVYEVAPSVMVVVAPGPVVIRALADTLRSNLQAVAKEVGGYRVEVGPGGANSLEVSVIGRDNAPAVEGEPEKTYLAFDEERELPESLKVAIESKVREETTWVPVVVSDARTVSLLDPRFGTPGYDLYG